MTKHNPRRTPDEWRGLVARQRASGLSIAEFARRESLAYQTFFRWCRKTDDSEPAAARSPSAPVERSSLPEFVELGIGGLTTEPDTEAATPSSDWLVELELGNGLTLRLRRAA